jgi:hypothetical protein
MRTAAAVTLLVVLASFGKVSAQTGAGDAAELKVASDLVARRAQFATAKLAVDLSSLSAKDRDALARLVAAAKVIDEVFRLQAWQGNPGLAARVGTLTGPLAPAARDYFRIMAGPWDRLKAFEPIIGALPHPPGAGFYPEDLTREQLEAYLAAHPAERAALTSPTTVVRRRDNGLAAVPYSKEYSQLLARAAAELVAAANTTENASLAKFLRLRADAFASDDYYASDLAWMDLDSAIEVVIGPYETYEDGLLGYKAAFEAFVCVEQPEESARLAKYKQQLVYLESSLPIDDELKNTGRGTASPIRVVDEVITAGDARRGVQTIAFNLPNDVRVRQAKGSKKVLLKNMMRAKYDAIQVPIATRVLTDDESGLVDFEPYFHFVLFHELSHGLGPGRITVDGRDTEVRRELKELYSAIEEAKADILGVYTLGKLAQKKVVDGAMVDVLPWTYVAGLFRAARFGATEAHGLGVVIQTNYLLKKGAVEVTKQGRFRPVPEKFATGVHDLAHDLLMIEAKGSYKGAQELIKRYGAVQPAMAKLLAGMTDLPVDVDPSFAADR